MMFTRTPRRPLLRLRRDAALPEPAGEKTSEDRPLLFPVEAVRSLPGRGWRGLGRDDAPVEEPRDGVIYSTHLVRQIESTLDRMQSGIDDVKGQIDSAFRLIFPPPAPQGDHRPSAA